MENTVDTTTVAHPRTLDTRELRALALAGEHFEEIAHSHRGGTYTVPSLHGEHTYDVTYTAREESCSCPDWQFGHTCYHVLAAAVIRAKTGICSGCGRRFKHRDMVEVLEEDHLTFYQGDVVCEACARNHGVL
jgi:hypothetical protein